MCGTDTSALRKQRNALPYNSDARREFQRLHKDQFLWEADHIVPVIEGGGECGLENYRTLCVRCHKKVTAELRRRLANRERERKAAERFAEARKLGWNAPEPAIAPVADAPSIPEPESLFD